MPVAVLNKTIDEPTVGIFTSIMHCGPLQLLLATVVTAIGLYHVTLLVLTLLGRRTPAAVGVHAILLFAGPCLLLLSVVAMLPTTLPKLFLVGIDEDDALKHILRFTSFLGWISLGIFIPNFFLCLLTLNRNQRMA